MMMMWMLLHLLEVLCFDVDVVLCVELVVVVLVVAVLVLFAYVCLHVDVCGVLRCVCL